MLRVLARMQYLRPEHESSYKPLRFRVSGLGFGV